MSTNDEDEDDQQPKGEITYWRAKTGYVSRTRLTPEGIKQFASGGFYTRITKEEYQRLAALERARRTRKWIVRFDAETGARIEAMAKQKGCKPAEIVASIVAAFFSRP